MNRINSKILLVWLLCVLVVVDTTASVPTRQPTTPPQSLSMATPAGQGTHIGNHVLTVQLVDITRADAPAVALSPWTSFDLAIDEGRLAHFSY